MEPTTTTNEGHRGEVQRSFAATRWTLVLRAKGNTPEARQALGELCEAYWQPVFRFLRRSGRDEDSARDLTQDFFTRLLERNSLAAADPARGRFRSFLLGALKHFLADTWDYEHRQKRGGGVQPESLEASSSAETGVGLQLPDPAAKISDEIFDREWALAIMSRALDHVSRALAAEGKAEHFQTLQPWLAGNAPVLSQAEASARLGLSEGALKVAIHRLRKRFREAVRNEIAQTLNNPADVQEELGYLVQVLSRG